MTCISCKRELPDDAVYCLYCGKKQTKTKAAYHRRGNGLGSAYKSPAGTWVAEITLGFYIENGKKKKKKQRKYGFKNKRDALLYLDKLRSSSADPKKITFSELWELYQPELEELSQSKQTAYKIAWDRIGPHLGYRLIADVTSDELQKIADKTAATYYTRRDIKTVLSQLYKIALRDDRVDKNRAQYIRLPQLEAAEREVFTDDEISKLWRSFRSAPDHVTAAALTMLYTGMRTGEIKDLKAGNIDLEGHFMTGGAKTEKGRRRKIIIPDKIVPVLQWLLSFGTEKLFPFGRNYLADKWQEKRTELGIRQQMTLYCCRHTYITNLTKLNVSPAMLQELVGHEDYETTLAYTHLSVEDRLAEVNRL